MLGLNFLASARVVCGEPRVLMDMMLQVQPCDRVSVEELCTHPWVVNSGWLPERVDTFELQCNDCDEVDAADSRGLHKLRTTWGSMCTAQNHALRQRLLWTTYAAICTVVLLWSLSHEPGDGVDMYVTTT